MECYPNRSQFDQAYEQKTPQLVWSEFLADTETPVSAMLKLAELSEHHMLFESVKDGATRERYSIIALDPDILWKCEGDKAYIKRDENEFRLDPIDPFDSLRALVAESRMDIPTELPPMATGLFGYMGYDMVKLMETLPDQNPDTIGVPQGMYMRPKITVIFDSVKGAATIITPVYCDDKNDAEQAYIAATQRIETIIDALYAHQIRSIYSRYYASDNGNEPCFTSHVDQVGYEAMVKKSKDYIRAGDIFQIVPSRRLSCPFTLPPMALYRSLRHLNPSPYLFYMQFGVQENGGFSLVGSSPEILVRVEENVVTIRPLAGTRKRGKDAEEDALLSAELLADEKECAEHLMLLDLGRNDVGRVAKVGSVKVTNRMQVEKYSHVMHIVSTVQGQLADDKDCFDALIAGFPAGTVSGAPKIRAMEIIDELEPETRSFYAGTVGYFSATGDMDTCITLRTGLVKDNRLYLQAGAGIVADSVPTSEYEETQIKAGALIAAARNAIKFT